MGCLFLDWSQSPVGVESPFFTHRNILNRSSVIPCLQSTVCGVEAFRRQILYSIRNWRYLLDERDMRMDLFLPTSVLGRVSSCLQRRQYSALRSLRCPDQSWTHYNVASCFSVRHQQYSYISTSAIKALPNVITSLRIAACPFLTYAIAHDMKGLALTGCVLAGFSDWLDGYIARRFQAEVLD